MHKTFGRVDDVLIERLFQPVADLLTIRFRMTRTGVTCFCVDLASLSWIASRAHGLSDAVTRWDATGSFLSFAMLLLGLLALTCLRTLFRRAGTKQGNPLRLAMLPHRAIVLLMLATRVVQLQAPGLADLADMGMLMFAASALYLGACTERPPVRRGWGMLSAAGRA